MAGGRAVPRDVQTGARAVGKGARECARPRLRLKPPCQAAWPDRTNLAARSVLLLKDCCSNRLRTTHCAWRTRTSGHSISLSQYVLSPLLPNSLQRPRPAPTVSHQVRPVPPLQHLPSAPQLRGLRALVQRPGREQERRFRNRILAAGCARSRAARRAISDCACDAAHWGRREGGSTSLPVFSRGLQLTQNTLFFSLSPSPPTSPPPLLSAQSDPSRRGDVALVQQLPLRDADIWFIRFGFDLGCRTLACGSRAVRKGSSQPHTTVPCSSALLRYTAGSLRGKHGACWQRGELLVGSDWAFEIGCPSGQVDCGTCVFQSTVCARLVTRSAGPSEHLGHANRARDTPWWAVHPPPPPTNALDPPPNLNPILSAHRLPPPPLRLPPPLAAPLSPLQRALSFLPHSSCFIPLFPQVNFRLIRPSRGWAYPCGSAHPPTTGRSSSGASRSRVQACLRMGAFDIRETSARRGGAAGWRCRMGFSC